jgi:hypothetical protein
MFIAVSRRKIAFDHVVAVDGFADLDHFGVAQLIDAALGRDASLLDDLLGELRANAVNVLKRDEDALVRRNVYASNTGHDAFLHACGPGGLCAGNGPKNEPIGRVVPDGSPRRRNAYLRGQPFSNRIAAVSMPDSPARQVVKLFTRHSGPAPLTAPEPP